MSLYVIAGTVTASILASTLTFISYFYLPQYFAHCALASAGSVLFGTIYVIVSYLWILGSVSYLK